MRPLAAVEPAASRGCGKKIKSEPLHGLEHRSPLPELSVWSAASRIANGEDGRVGQSTARPIRGGDREQAVRDRNQRQRRGLSYGNTEHSLR